MHRDGFKVLPTFAVAPVLKAIFDQAKQGKQAPGMSYGFDRILHGEQYLELKRPLPQKATLEHKVKIKDIFDKGKNALVITEVKSYDETGDLLAVNELTTVVRGAGGWGGDRGPSGDSNVPPSARPTRRSRSGSARTRRCSIACPATGTPSTRTPSSRAPSASPAPSSTGCARSGTRRAT